MYNSKRKSAKLDEEGAERHSWGVKSLFLVIFFATLAVASKRLGAQDSPPPLAPLPKIAAEVPRSAVSSAAPADVVASAVAAVASLGEQVAMGRYEVAVQRMNPAWKERTAKRRGGMEQLEKQLSGVAKQMVQQGISIISFKPQGAARSYEVGPGRKVETVGGAEVESLVFHKWLVLVPTATKFRVIREGQTKPTLIDSVGFQVAISDKGQNNWTFIDGSGLTVNDLRGLFATLPQDLQFPPLEKRESR